MGGLPRRDQRPSWLGEPDPPLDHPASPRCDSARIGTEAYSEGGQCLSGDGRTELVNASILGRGEGRAEPGLRGGRCSPCGTDGELADASGARAEAWHPEPERWQQGVAAEPIHHRGPLFPPGPGDRAAWADALAAAPHLAPAAGLGDCFTWACDMASIDAHENQAAAEPGLRRMAHGMAARSRALRLLGNGVVPLAAAFAWRTLATAHGLGPVDLGRNR